MIKQILEILKLDDFIGKSESIEIVKGKYKIPKTATESYNQAIRELKNKRIGNGRKKGN